APGGGRGDQPNNFPQVRSDFIKAEGALGVFSTAPRGHGVYTIGGARANTDPATILPQITITAEHYGRIARMIARNVPVTIEADIKNTYYDNPPMFNVVGEIAATDNGAGAGAMMEAMRILKASSVKLRRTVRIGLWPGEEQGLNGSAEYVAMHYGVCPPPPPPPPGTAPNAGRGGGGFGRGCPVALQLKPEHAKFAGYFNIDNGTGALRGVYLQQNEAAAPIFREWMEPFRDRKSTRLNS